MTCTASASFRETAIDSWLPRSNTCHDSARSPELFGPVKIAGHVFVLTEWVKNGRHPRLKLPDGAARTGDLLARFHRASSGLTFRQATWRNSWGRLPRRLLYTLERIQDLYLSVRERLAIAFDQEFLAKGPRFLRLARTALEKLDSDSYRAATAESLNDSGLVHGDLHSGNVFMTTQRAVLVDIECGHREIPVYDLYQTLCTHGFNLSIFREVDIAYQNIQPLSQAQRATLRFLCRFPGAPFSSVRGYYRNGGSRDTGRWVRDFVRHAEQAEEVNLAIDQCYRWPWTD